MLRTPAAQAQTITGPGRLVFSAVRTPDGRSEIFSADIAGELIVNLTNDPAPDLTPNWSPDGSQIAFMSRREQNWDVYLMQADGRNLQRLTEHPAYDGEPAFAPDGRSLAFASSRNGNLDLYLLDLASMAVTQLTDDPAADYGPSWSPDGQGLAFTSWRDGQQEVYALDLAREVEGMPPARNLTRNDAPDYDPAWSPDGQRIAFVTDREEIGTLMVLDLYTGRLTQAGPTGRTLADPSWAPTGGLLAAGSWVIGSQRFTARAGVLITTPGVVGATYLVGGPHTYGDPSWNARAGLPALDTGEPGRLLTIAPTTPPEPTEGLRELTGVTSGGRNLLAADVYPSFVELRRAVIAASGHDFLARLSEATRPVDFYSSASSYTSWHKAGRAFDTLFDYTSGGRQVLYIVPEPVASRLFWRLYLRAANQDGSQGAPLTASVFNPTTHVLSPPPAGYYVDFTDLAAQYGWRRIAAQERDNFNWRSELLALEYWHFEKRDGLSWYQAMSLVHSQATLERLFSVETLREVSTRPGFITNLGLPWAAPPPPVAGPIVRQRGPR